MPNCQVCPILEECQQAKNYMELMYHEQFKDCVIVRYLNHEIDNYISIGLLDPEGYKPYATDIHKQRLSTPEASPRQEHTVNVTIVNEDESKKQHLDRL